MFIMGICFAIPIDTSSEKLHQDIKNENENKNNKIARIQMCMSTTSVSCFRCPL